MEIQDLPASELVGTASSMEELTYLLLEAVHGLGHPFLFMDIIRGSNRSGRILLQRPAVGLKITEVPLPGPMMAVELANDLFLPVMLAQSRYPPFEQRGEAKKAWEVRRLEFPGECIVVVWATWVPVEPKPVLAPKNVK